MVCFINGQPSVKNYRHYIPRTVEGPNDFATMKEVVGRRYTRLIEEKAELLRKNGDIDGANKLMNSIGNEKEAQEALAKINAQDKFNASMDKMKAILTSIVDGPATMLVNLISSTVEFATRFSPIFKAAAIALTPILGILTAMWVRTQAIAIMASIKLAFETFGAVPVVGFGLALAAAAAGAAYIYSQPKPAGDMYSPADGKTQVSTKEGGLFELSKNDSLMAFPEKKGSGGSGRGSASIDISPLVAEMQNVKAVLSQILAKEGVVYMDSDKVGTTMNIGVYKAQ
jgi:hypothetical protein